MSMKQGFVTSSGLFLLLLLISFFIPVEVFTRAEGEITPYHAIAHADFAEDGLLARLHVAEGDPVNQGDIIAELDNQEFKINLDIFNNKHRQTHNKLSHLHALLEQQQNHEPANEKALSAQMARFNILRQNYQDSLANLAALVAIDHKKNDAIQSLANKNAVGSLVTIDSTQRLLRDKKDLLKVKKDFEERIIFEIERYEELKNDIENSIRLYRYYLNRSYVKAPVSGTIRHLHVDQAGQYINRGDRFADIIENAPKPFKIKLNIPADEIGMIVEEAKVRMRINTYDHSIFGTLNGTISRVSLDRTHEHQNERFYRVMVIPDETALIEADQVYPLKYGMTLYGTIERGQVSLISYLMKPIIKHFHEVGHL